MTGGGTPFDHSTVVHGIQQLNRSGDKPDAALLAATLTMLLYGLDDQYDFLYKYASQRIAPANPERLKKREKYRERAREGRKIGYRYLSEKLRKQLEQEGEDEQAERTKVHRSVRAGSR